MSVRWALTMMMGGMDARASATAARDMSNGTAGGGLGSTGACFRVSGSALRFGNTYALTEAMVGYR